MKLIMILIGGMTVLFAIVRVLVLIGQGIGKHRRKGKAKKAEKKKILEGSKRLEDYKIYFLPVGENSVAHPHYVFAEKGEKLISINTTHSKPKGKGTIKLNHNPDPKDETKTYAVKELHLTDLEVSKKEKDRRKRGWSYTPKDIKKMEKWINK